MRFSGGALRAVALVAPLAVTIAVSLLMLMSPQPANDVPTRQDWSALAQTVASGFEPGDVIRIDPPWLTAGRAWLGDVDGGTREPFRILDLHREMDIPWLLQFKRMWWAVADETDIGVLTDAGAVVNEQWTFGTLSLYLLDLPRERLAWSLVGQLDQLEVIRGKGDKVCRFSGTRHVCGKSGPDVEVELRQVAGGPRQCLLVKPAAKGQPTTVRAVLPAVDGTLALRFGNTVEAGRQKDGSEVLVKAVLGDLDVGQLNIPRADYDLHEIVYELDSNGPTQLDISISAIDERKREICIDGYIIRR